jgi:hypothetical protein
MQIKTLIALEDLEEKHLPALRRVEHGMKGLHIVVAQQSSALNQLAASSSNPTSTVTSFYLGSVEVGQPSVQSSDGNLYVSQDVEVVKMVSFAVYLYPSLAEQF